MPYRHELFCLLLVCLSLCLPSPVQSETVAPLKPLPGSFKGFTYRVKSSGKPLEGGTFLHVRAEAQPGGDGSFEKPFADIGQALAKAESGNIVYIWGGVYEVAQPRDTVGASVYAVNVNLTVVGSSTPLAAATGEGVIPAQQKKPPVVKAVNLHERPTGDPNHDVIGYIPLFSVADGVDLTLMGLHLEGPGTGYAVFMGRPRGLELNSGRLDVYQCDIENFSYGIYSNGPMTFLQTRMSRNRHAVASNGHGRADMIMSESTLSHNGDAIYNPYGLVSLDTGNVVEYSDEGVFAGSILMGCNNTISHNQRFGLSANGDIRIRNNNQFIANGLDGRHGDAVRGASLLLGDNNVISGNYNALNARTGDLSVGSNNTISDNSRVALYSGGAGLLSLGSHNVISNNGRSGLENQQGSIQVGDGNSIIGNGENGILCFNGEIALGAGNRVSQNRRDGIVGKELIRLGGNNTITANRTDAPASYGDIRLNPTGQIEAQPTDTVGKIAHWGD